MNGYENEDWDLVKDEIWHTPTTQAENQILCWRISYGSWMKFCDQCCHQVDNQVISQVFILLYAQNTEYSEVS